MTMASAPPVRESPWPAYLSLFASLSTLVCCALPALFVLLGLGASVASALSALPWLVALSRHKAWVFAGSGLLVAATAWYVYALAPALLRRSAACSDDDASACARASRLSRAVLLTSAAIYVVGFAVAFLLGPVLTALDR